MAAPPILSDGVVLLRPLVASDADEVAEACQDAQIQAWTTVPSPYHRQHAADFVAQRSDPQTWWRLPTWAVTAPPSERWIGSIDLRLDDDGGADVGFLLAPWGRGRGLAARALRLACTWGFSALGLQVVTWYALVGNEASRATARNAGFRVHDAVLRRHLPHRGERRDAWVGDLLPEDLLARATARSSLTRRERQVLQRLAYGDSNREVAAALGVSENTVKNHVRSILEKLSARSRGDAVVIGLRQGLVALPG